MTVTDHSEYLRTTDVEAFAALATDQRYSQKLLDRTSGGERVGVSLIRTPAGQGSPEGLHTHDFEQVFYVVRGTMNIEIDGSTFRAPAGSLVRFPQNVPHRNWNDGEDSLHLAINVPAPVLGTPAAKPVR
ncbi:MAG TPA: cupin domain-containing protein [Pseudonocardiaceae bacterium]|jgi:quercetin dioxygenase-like cupin family protein|nr:cupin domain-containing protein [Pseudonocardiaceae bacterium]